MKIENKIKIFNIPDRVTCRICGKERKALNNAHLNSHGLTQKTYKQKFPNAETHSAETRLKISKKRKKWIKDNPEKFIPPKSKIQEYLKNKETKEKLHLHNKLVQNLPYRKQALKNQLSKCERNNKKKIMLPKIKELIKVGYSVPKIEKILKIHNATIYRWLKEG